VAETDTFLAQLNISYSDRWRNVGLLFVYIVFNVFAAVFLYWLIRVPKKRSRKIKEE
jgi:ABC-type multidrug transport system permease subunit